MGLKILHLNILQGQYLSNLVKFAKEQKFDVLSLQEVGSNVRSRKSPKVAKTFEKLKSSLSLNGELAISWKDEKNNNSYFGNAILYNKKFKKIHSEILWMKKYKKINPVTIKYQNAPNCALNLTLNVNEKPITFISTHLVWGPTPDDKKYKLKQNRKFYHYVKTLKNPFVLTGDFNLTPESKVVSWFGKISQNLIAKNKISNTLNPRTHYAKWLFPEGLAVDYVFVSKKLKVKSFKVVEKVDLSDHFGLVTEIRI